MVLSWEAKYSSRELEGRHLPVKMREAMLGGCLNIPGASRYLFSAMVSIASSKSNLIFIGHSYRHYTMKNDVRTIFGFDVLMVSIIPDSCAVNYPHLR
jgi:hypothetical protein